MSKEEWKDVERWEGKYKISSFGRILSVRRGIYKIPDMNNAGYLRIQFADMVNGKRVRERYFVHRLVAHHFVEGEQEGLVINHKDGNKSNNHMNNLEWVTAKENAQHAQRTGLFANCKQFREKPYYLMTTTREILCYPNIKELARSIGYCKSSCYNWIKNGGRIPHSDLIILSKMPRDYPIIGVNDKVIETARHENMQDIVRHSQECEETESMGYHRPVSGWNEGKQAEYRERKYFREPAQAERNK